MSMEAVEMTWVPSCGRVAIWCSRQHQPGDPQVLVTPEAVEVFIGRVRAGDYGHGTEPPPRTLPLGEVLGDRQVLSVPGRGDIDLPPVGPCRGPATSGRGEGIMRKILLSVTAVAAVAAPLALTGTASAATTAPAHLTGGYYTNVGHQMHLWHVAHVAHEAHLGY